MTPELDKLAAELVAAHPDKAEQAFLKPSLAGWFVGQMMKATGGKADISLARWAAVSAITRAFVANSSRAQDTK